MDTNVIVRVLNGDRDLVSKLSQMEGLCSCTVVLGELLYGAEKSQRSEQNKQNAKSFCSFAHAILLLTLRIQWLKFMDI